MNYNILSSSGSNKLYQHNIVFCFENTSTSKFYLVNIILLNAQEEKYTSSTFLNSSVGNRYIHGNMKDEEDKIRFLSTISRTNNNMSVGYMKNYQTTNTNSLYFKATDSIYINTFKDNVVQIL